MTTEDERAIARRLRDDGAYSYRVDDPERETSLALFDRTRRLRGRVAKRHGVYILSDARGSAVLRTRRLEEVLRALAP